MDLQTFGEILKYPYIWAAKSPGLAYSLFVQAPLLR